MPLTRGQRKKKRAMQREYGTSAGTRIFYASENKHHARHMKRRKKK